MASELDNDLEQFVDTERLYQLYVVGLSPCSTKNSETEGFDFVYVI